jgi:hypothetical protein
MFRSSWNMEDLTHSSRRGAILSTQPMIGADLSSLATLEHGELLLETGSTYDGILPVRIRVSMRDRRYTFSDEGRAVAAAGIGPGRIDFAGRIPLGEYSANVSRKGVVSLPGFAGSSERWLAKLPELVAEGSLALYEELLELDDAADVPAAGAPRGRSRRH